MWDQDKQQMEQESSKTSFALIRLTLDYINMRNLGITVRRITPNANQFLAWIIGSSIPERKCMIGKGWVDTFIWVSTGCSIWAQNVFARSNGFRNRNFDSYLWLSPNIGNLQVGSEKRKKMKNEPPFSTFRKKMNKCCAQPKNMTYFFGPCNDFFSKLWFSFERGTNREGNKTKGKKGLHNFLLPFFNILYSHTRKIFQCNLHILAHCRSERKIDWKFEKWSQKRFPYIHITFF